MNDRRLQGGTSSRSERRPTSLWDVLPIGNLISLGPLSLPGRTGGARESEREGGHGRPPSQAPLGRFLGEGCGRAGRKIGVEWAAGMHRPRSRGHRRKVRKSPQRCRCPHRSARGARRHPPGRGTIRVPAVIADQIRALGRNVLRELGQKIQRPEGRCVHRLVKDYRTATGRARSKAAGRRRRASLRRSVFAHRDGRRLRRPSSPAWALERKVLPWPAGVGRGSAPGRCR